MTISTPQVESVERCPICGSADAGDHFRCPDEDDVRGLEYRSCSACGTVYLSRRVREHEVGVLYPEHYSPYVPPVAQHGSRSRLRRRLGCARRWLLRLDPRGTSRNLERFYWGGEPGRLLDFGCGSAAFLDVARSRGWETIGSDFSIGVLERVREAGHEAHHPTELDEMIADGSIDAIRMNHVLEHLYEPRQVIESLAAKLSARGRIHIAVPNPRGFSARLFRDAWPGFEPRHVILYPPHVIVQLLRDAGFGTAYVIHESTTRDFLGSLDNRRRGVRDAHHRNSPLMSSSLANRVLRPFAKILAWAGIGDRIHVFGER